MAYVFDIMLRAEETVRARPWYQSLVEREAKKQIRLDRIKKIADPDLRAIMGILPEGTRLLTLTHRPMQDQVSEHTDRIVELEDDDSVGDADDTKETFPEEHRFSSDPNFGREKTPNVRSKKRPKAKARKGRHAQSQSLTNLEATFGTGEVETRAATIERMKSESPPLSLEEARKETREKRANSLRERRDSVAFLKERTRTRVSRANSEATTDNDASSSNFRRGSASKESERREFTGAENPQTYINNRAQIDTVPSLCETNGSKSTTSDEHERLNPLATDFVPATMSSKLPATTPV